MDLMNIKKRSSHVLALSAAAALALAACTSPSAENNGQDGDTLSVLASFYPLQFVTEQIGGDLVTVESLTPKGAEPHDLELSPAHTRSISSADLIVYQAGFQKAVDEAIEARNPEHVYDASVHAEGPASDAHDEDDADDHSSDDEHVDHDHDGDGHADHDAEDHVDEEHTDDDHADEEQADSHDGHDHGATDPHFWLDPTLLAATAQDIAHELSELDPDNAVTYEANATTLVANLTALDAQYADELSTTCQNRTIVVTHEAFGYLAAKYDFKQIGISGIDPEAEPSPAKIREIRATIADTGITTIFFETLTSPKVAQTLASDLGIETAVLDPLEGLVDDTQDYFSVMQSNLIALKAGMLCE
jgi:zinc transport system substrate-binding protein